MTLWNLLITAHGGRTVSEKKLHDVKGYKYIFHLSVCPSKVKGQGRVSY